MTQTIKNLFDSDGGVSRYYVSSDEARLLISKGCVMCSRQFTQDELWVNYETSDLWVIGLNPVEVADIRLSLYDGSRDEYWKVSDENVFIVDRKAAVCLKCWTEFLRQVAALKGSEK